MFSPTHRSRHIWLLPEDCPHGEMAQLSTCVAWSRVVSFHYLSLESAGILQQRVAAHLRISVNTTFPELLPPHVFTSLD